MASFPASAIVSRNGAQFLLAIVQQGHPTLLSQLHRDGPFALVNCIRCHPTNISVHEPSIQALCLLTAHAGLAASVQVRWGDGPTPRTSIVDRVSAAFCLNVLYFVQACAGLSACVLALSRGQEMGHETIVLFALRALRNLLHESTLEQAASFVGSGLAAMVSSALTFKHNVDVQREVSWVVCNLASHATGCLALVHAELLSLLSAAIALHSSDTELLRTGAHVFWRCQAHAPAEYLAATTRCDASALASVAAFTEKPCLWLPSKYQFPHSHADVHYGSFTYLL
jgi:hypothetical protein